jgi:hypothetical protein
MMRQFVLLSSLALAGCYSYLPVNTATPPHGSDVSVDVNVSGSDSLARLIGPGVRTIAGRVIEADDSGLTLAVTSTSDGRNLQVPWSGERVTVPRVAMERVRERRFSVGRSALLGGAVLGATVAAAAAVAGGASGGTVPGGGSQTPQ